MNVFFDMDYTIFGQDGSVRPGTHEVLEQLVGLGHDVYIWSGVGVRWAEVRDAGLEPFVKGVYRKPLSDYREGLARFGVPVVPDFVIDDYPGIVHCFGGHCIKEYIGRHAPDEEMYSIPGHIDAHFAAFSPPTSLEG